MANPVRVLVTTEQHFIASGNGLYTETVGGYSFWKRYLAVFDEVVVIARVKKQATPPEKGTRADGDGVRFFFLPDYTGPFQYLRYLPELQSRARAIVCADQAIILRVPGAVSGLVWNQILRRQPYGLEVVGDPCDVFAHGAARHPLRSFFRWWFSRRLRHQCAQASAVAYVTECTLQRRYPPGPNAFVTHYSNVDLPEAAFAIVPRRPNPQISRFILITVCSLAQLHKGQDLLLDAMALCLAEGLDVELVIVGDGRYRPELETRAAALGLSERVHFIGRLPAGEAVRAQLDRADLFVLPSRAEGLPRAMIEAMARGLPCIGSTVGGIPELLPVEDLVPPGDSIALAQKIREVLTDPRRMARMSERNLEKAREYQEGVLRERRIMFYQYVRGKTEEWLRNRQW